ncbi:tyrosine-type recombinase/integrase, partial [Streptomyces sp. UMAF16]|nr:tyrosine-type recombinase/integrase [Streptomyces sp. UMAF16]
RHTFATLSLEAGTDIRYLQEMLGHTSITSTKIYTKVNSTKLHQEFDKAQKNLSLS